jgi:hypothetical protein
MLFNRKKSEFLQVYLQRAAVLKLLVKKAPTRLAEKALSTSLMDDELV